MQSGRIVEERKNYYVVDTPEYGEVQAVLKGAIRKKTKRLAVGDKVTVDVFDSEKREAVVRTVEKRVNELPRPVIANIDQVLFLNCLIEPALDFSYMDRFLYAASVHHISVKLLFNKSDLLDAIDLEELDQISDEYRRAGYEILYTSIEDDNSVKEIAMLCEGKLSVFAGPSGVGKSSLMQKLFVEHDFVTNELSEKIQRGKNTTTHTSLLRLENGGYVADTPGFSYMKMPKLELELVREHFHEISDIGADCRFNNCTHRHEPGCVVKDAVEEEVICGSRYQNYLDLVVLMDAAAKDPRKRNVDFL